MRRLAVMLGGAVAVAYPASPALLAQAVDPRAPCTSADGSGCASHLAPPQLADVRVIIRSRNLPPGRVPPLPVNSLGELYSALRRCWQPPVRADAHFGMQMSVRFSFKRSGEIIGPPHVTFVGRAADAELRRIYLGAITASLDRCTPMPFTREFGGALAGRPLSIRFIDDRTE